MDLNKIRIDIDRLENLIKRISHEYHQYFIGNLKYPPTGTERDINVIFNTYNKMTITNTMLNFRYKNLVAKYLTLNEKWNRTKMENDGHKKTYKENVSKIENTNSKTTETFNEKIEKQLEKLSGFYDVDKIRSQVEDKIKALKNKGYTDIDIFVDRDENGKAKLRIKPVK